MTCIIGLVDNEFNNVIIGGDSAAICENNIIVRKDVKVFKNSEFIIGCTTSFRMMQILRFLFKPPKINKEIYEYMCTDFISEVRKCFKSAGYMQRDELGEERGGQFLVGYKNKLFVVDYDFHVGENLHGYDAIGCGGNYALAVLDYLNKEKKEMPAIDKATKALEVSENLCNGVKKPFEILRT